MPRINLLPWREQERRERKNSFLVMLGGALVGGLLASGAFYLIMTSMISAQQERNDRLRVEIQILDRQIQEINNLETQKQRFISRMQVIDKLQRSRSEALMLRQAGHQRRNVLVTHRRVPLRRSGEHAYSTATAVRFFRQKTSS